MLRSPSPPLRALPGLAPRRQRLAEERSRFEQQLQGELEQQLLALRAASDARMGAVRQQLAAEEAEQRRKLAAAMEATLTAQRAEVQVRAEGLLLAPGSRSG